RDEGALEYLVLRLPLRLRHAVALFQVAAGAERALAGTGQHHAAQLARLGAQPCPQVELVAAHLRIERIEHLRTVEAHDEDVLFPGLQGKRLVLHQRIRPASRKYLSAPGWIRSMRGAAATVFAAVVSLACSRRAASGPSAQCNARASR